MSKGLLHVAEFVDNVLPVQLPAGREQWIEVQGKSTQSVLFGEHTHIVRLYADEACAVAVGTEDVEATTRSMPLAAGKEHYFRVPPGHRLAVISNF